MGVDNATTTLDPGAAMATPTESTETPAPSTEPTNVLGDIGAAQPVVDPFDSEGIKLPDGYERGDNFEAFAGIMKEFGVSQSKAQELIGFHQAAIESALKDVTDRWHEQQGKWQQEIQADSELGGRNFEGVKQTIARVLDNRDLTDPGFREAVSFTGAGNHPAIVRTIYRWAKALSEGAGVDGGAPIRNRDGSLANVRPSPGQAMYGPDGPHTGGPKLS